jgi:hypothetical protein
MKIWGFGMSVPFYSFHLNSQTREWSFHSLLLKLPNRGKEKIFFFFPFHSIPFPPPKHSVRFSQKIVGLHYINISSKMPH